MSEKRSVHTDALDTLGSIIDDTAKRDAIHLAVEPCIAGELLSPGDDIGLLANNLALKNTPSSYEIDIKYVGIVDPFLKRDVQPGEKFWMIIYPRTITSLRHVWSHPSFTDEVVEKSDPEYTEEQIEASEKWIRKFIDDNDTPDYDTLIAAASDDLPLFNISTSYCKEDGYLHFSGEDAHGEIPNEFWDHVEIVTGKKITDRPEYFSCSC